jgi:hypothetical protein
MQVCHGKGTPLRRVSPGDHVAYYSPTGTVGGKDTLQAFTAIGVVQPGLPYQAEMVGGFRPFRRDVAWSDAVDAPIRPLLGLLSFSRQNRNWGYKLRFGLFEIGRDDMRLIGLAMAPRGREVGAHLRPPTSSM